MFHYPTTFPQSGIKKEEDNVAKKEIKDEIDDLSDDKKKDKKIKKEKKENKKAKKNKQAAGPMHFTANNEPRAVDVIGELDPPIFDEVNVILLTDLCIFLLCTYRHKMHV